MLGEDEAEEAELNPFSFREFVRHHGPEPGSADPSGTVSPADQSARRTAAAETQQCSPPVNQLLNTLMKSLVLAIRSGTGAGDTGAPAPHTVVFEPEDDALSLVASATEFADYGADTAPQDTASGHGSGVSSRSSAHSGGTGSEDNSMVPKKKKKKSFFKSPRIQQLSDELVRRRCEEEKEAQALESMVHSVEQNLHLMTKRAVKAENSVSKLKQDLQQLLGHMEVIKSENERLLAEQLETMTTMRQNAQTAAEYLGKTAIQARSSIKSV
ncbi:unnamed protein product [Merluccius merluccius]